MQKNTIMLIVLIVLSVILTLHYFSQRLLLAKGLKAENPKSYIKRFVMNGVVLVIFSAIILIQAANSPYRLLGLFFLFEAGVCIASAVKLSKK